MSIRVIRNKPNKRVETYLFTTCSSGSGIVMMLDKYAAHRINDEDEPVALESYSRTFSVSDTNGPRFTGSKSKEVILEQKKVPEDVKREAMTQLLETIEFVN
ncbi:hypothetical protein L1267_21760 [Pseudoalteromonas sp. OFAV1]|jgi:hypothetical protein|uniref:hypothetical protein n=1 Tax=Pseudoalteromonas sp. OFAV1 TaxID=2908892 RepID=UPI001F36FD8F|nr:hypothetical protein [Pseudoalteromonas sp. OFAV1]MCF2903003.1 hypothetical protein [Pseudoalteromonas sp. OFAV1]